jgi:hypothetical protein
MFLPRFLGGGVKAFRKNWLGGRGAPILGVLTSLSKICLGGAVHTKHHSFPVPVSENQTGNYIFLLPNFETENLFPKNFFWKPETLLRKPGTIFGKPGKPLSLFLSLSLV